MRSGDQFWISVTKHTLWGIEQDIKAYSHIVITAQKDLSLAASMTPGSLSIGFVLYPAVE